MKNAIKNLLGPSAISQLRSLRRKYFPLPQSEQKDIDKKKNFYGSFVTKGDLCFDVGANVGNRITPLLGLGARVVAVEPQESCYRALRTEFGNKISLVTKGLGEKEELRQFHISNASTISSFSTEWIDEVKKNRFSEYNWDKTVEVEMTTLDNLIRTYGLPAFIKIDVEGYELEVLKGLTSPVKYISFEYTVPEQVQNVIDCINRIVANDPEVECNFSIGETMEWANSYWKSADDMKSFVTSAEFINTGYGDIYVRMKTPAAG